MTELPAGSIEDSDCDFPRWMPLPLKNLAGIRNANACGIAQ